MSNAAACIVPQNTPACPTPDTDWDGPYGCVKAATWYQEVLGWLILPAHYLLDWQGSGIFACSCAQHTTCHTAGKHPALPYQHLEAPLPLHTLRAFWTHGKRLPYNVSLLTGHRSGVLVADLDAKPIYPLSVGERLDLLRAEGWPVDDTCVERTGALGVHVLASVPRDLRVPSRGVYLTDGCELFAERKQIIISPSKHKSGRRYAWLEGRAPWQCAVSPLPEATVQALMSPSTSPGPSAAHRAKTPTTSPTSPWPDTRRMTPARLVDVAVERAHERQDGGRHATMARLASRLAYKGLPKEALVDALLAYQQGVVEGWDA